jgi:hypothetical protein
MIPETPNTSKNQGFVSNHPSSQLPIRKPTTTDNPSSKPIELYIIHFGPDLRICFTSQEMSFTENLF